MTDKGYVLPGGSGDKLYAIWAGHDDLAFVFANDIEEAKAYLLATRPAPEQAPTECYQILLDRDDYRVAGKELLKCAGS